MKNKDIDLPAIYRLILNQTARILQNQNEMLEKLDTLIEQGGEQSAMDLLVLQQKLNKARQELREKEIEDYFNKQNKQ